MRKTNKGDLWLCGMVPKKGEGLGLERRYGCRDLLLIPCMNKPLLVVYSYSYSE